MLKTIAFTALVVALLGVGVSESFARGHGYGYGGGYGPMGYGGYGQCRAYNTNARGQFQSPCWRAGQTGQRGYGRGPAWAPQNGQPAVAAPGAGQAGGV